jgi:hypothetical protein
MNRRNPFALLALTLTLFCAPAFAASDAPAPAPSPTPVPSNRVASIYVAQDFINEQLAAHAGTGIVRKLKVELDADHGQMFLVGLIQVPVEELRAVNLDPALGAFKFRVTVKPETTRHGHLILEFPLDETYFYPANSKDPKHDRVIIPVQMLSLALASARGYLAALSGDFSGFNRRSEKLTALMKDLDHSIETEKNADAVEDLKNQREALRLQLAAVPVERKQLEVAGKEVEHILGFTGEKELNLNDELGARKNALVFKIKLSQLAPFLNGVELGGIRILRDKKDGAGQNFFAVDVDSELDNSRAPSSATTPKPHVAMKTAPSIVMRLNQSLFESSALLEAEKKEMGSKLRDFEMNLKEDGLHVSGKWHAFLFNIPFDTTVDFVTTGLDTFEIRVRDLDVAGIDLEFLSKFVLESMKKRLESTLKGICTFKYMGTEKDHSRSLQVTVDPKALVPAFPDLHLVAVDVRDHEFLLKIGRPDAAVQEN